MKATYGPSRKISKVGRKSRRATDAPYKLGISAPDLSRAGTGLSGDYGSRYKLEPAVELDQFWIPRPGTNLTTRGGPNPARSSFETPLLIQSSKVIVGENPVRLTGLGVMSSMRLSASILPSARLRKQLDFST